MKVPVRPILNCSLYGLKLSFLFATVDGIRKALPYTEKAEAEYERLQAHVPLSHIQCFSAMLYHNLGDTVQRDAAAARNLKSEKLADQMSGLATDKMTIEVWQLVKEIGAALALRA
jgi:anaphase-promoting complex subunit 5